MRVKIFLTILIFSNSCKSNRYNIDQNSRLFFCESSISQSQLLLNGCYEESESQEIKEYPAYNLYSTSLQKTIKYKSYSNPFFFFLKRFGF